MKNKDICKKIYSSDNIPRNFLPTNKKEMQALGWERADFICITGDAYVDHPSFGISVIARYLESFGYKVAILAQPNWLEENSIKQLGEPCLGFLVSAGNLDSMVNHYYVSRKKRAKDVYSVNDQAGKRPDDATITYCQLIRQSYPHIPIIIGGLEASLRRFSHYDYIKDKLRPSILLESKADLLVYSMGEKAMIEIADYLQSGVSIKDLSFISGTCVKASSLDNWVETIVLPEYSKLLKHKSLYGDSFLLQYHNNEYQSAKVIAEPYPEGFIVQNLPQVVLTQEELDHVYELPFTYESYDEYYKKGKVSALEEIKYSIALNRGCNGGCNFCAITFHQGKQVSMRSQISAVQEAKYMTGLEDFKGYIHDVGGPTANFNQNMCDKLNTTGSCKHKDCFTPELCKNLKVDHQDYFAILKEIRELDRVKKVFIRSGIRYDYLLKERNNQHLKDLIQFHVSGQLRLAPEHCNPKVLKLMNKPKIEIYEAFVKRFNVLTQNIKKEQYTVPYFISSHPGSTLEEALELAIYLKTIHYKPMQVQDFYPTPGTLSTVMYYTGIDPRTKTKIYVPRSDEEKAMQRALLQTHLPQNYDLVYEALKTLNRLDLISYNEQALLRPSQDRSSMEKLKTDKISSPKTPSLKKNKSYTFSSGQKKRHPENRKKK